MACKAARRLYCHECYSGISHILRLSYGCVYSLHPFNYLRSWLSKLAIGSQDRSLSIPHFLEELCLRRATFQVTTVSGRRRNTISGRLFLVAAAPDGLRVQEVRERPVKSVDMALNFGEGKCEGCGRTLRLDENEDRAKTLALLCRRVQEALLMVYMPIGTKRRPRRPT